MSSRGASAKLLAPETCRAGVPVLALQVRRVAQAALGLLQLACFRFLALLLSTGGQGKRSLRRTQQHSPMRCPSRGLLVAPRPVQPVTTLDGSAWFAINAPGLFLDKREPHSLDAPTRRLAIPQATRSPRPPAITERVSPPAALDRHKRIAAHHGTTCAAHVEVDEAGEDVKVMADDQALFLVLARSSRSTTSAAAGLGESSARSKRRSFRPSLGSIHERGAGKEERREDEQELADGTGSSEGSEVPSPAAWSSSEGGLSMYEAGEGTPASSVAPESPPARTGSPSPTTPSRPPTAASLRAPAAPAAARLPSPQRSTAPSCGPLRALVARLNRLRAQAERRAPPRASLASSARPASRKEGVRVVVEVEVLTERELREDDERA